MGSLRKNSKGRVLVAMSGGVDSSAAAGLLVDQGYEVVGMTMQVWDYSTCEIEEGNGTCCSSIDVDDARAVADKLDFPFYVANCEAKFKANVIDPFIEAYLKGQTPSPCVNCNTFLKFDHLLKKMEELECDYLATGHYARIENGPNGQKVIATSTDDWKDQTYFLFTIKPEVIPKLLFPIGDMKKPDVRAYAEARGLVNARKKDSTGICFVGNKGYTRFIDEQTPHIEKKSGVFRKYPSGEVLGEHGGIYRFTLGQRKGLGMDFHETLFVVKLDIETNTVWVGDEKFLFTNEMEIADCSWLDDFSIDDELRVKIRFHHKGSEAKIERFKDESGAELARVKFSEPQRAITPGQAAVIYRGDHLVGGGWIRPA